MERETRTKPSRIGAKRRNPLDIDPAIAGSYQLTDHLRCVAQKKTYALTTTFFLQRASSGAVGSIQAE